MNCRRKPHIHTLHALVSLLGLLLLCYSCNNEEARDYTLEARVTSMDGRQVWAIQENWGGGLSTTPVTVSKGFFRYKNSSDSLNRLNLYLPNLDYPIQLFVTDGGWYEIEGDAAKPFELKVSGSDLNADLSEFRNTHASLLMALYGEDNVDRSRSDSLWVELRQEVQDYVQENPKRMASSLLISSYMLDFDNPERANELLLSLPVESRHPLAVKEIKAFTEKANRLPLGSDMPLFSAIEASDTLFHTRIYRNLPTLYVFWLANDKARRSQMSMLRTLAQSREKEGLRTVYVSLDADSAYWRSLVRTDSLTGVQVNFPLGWSDFQIDRISVPYTPYTLLQDRTGKVVARGEMGMELLNAIDKVFHPEEAQTLWDKLSNE